VFRVPCKRQRLSQLNCQVLEERITAHLQLGLIRSYHMQGLFKIINPVIISTLSLWGQIFLLPKNVPDKVNIVGIACGALM